MTTTGRNLGLGGDDWIASKALFWNWVEQKHLLGTFNNFCGIPYASWWQGTSYEVDTIQQLGAKEAPFKWWKMILTSILSVSKHWLNRGESASDPKTTVPPPAIEHRYPKWSYLKPGIHVSRLIILGIYSSNFGSADAIIFNGYFGMQDALLDSNHHFAKGNPYQIDLHLSLDSQVGEHFLNRYSLHSVNS